MLRADLYGPLSESLNAYEMHARPMLWPCAVSVGAHSEGLREHLRRMDGRVGKQDTKARGVPLVAGPTNRRSIWDLNGLCEEFWMVSGYSGGGLRSVIAWGWC